jgi:aldehyde:ferredoxin oxidoreductase
MNGFYGRILKVNLNQKIFKFDTIEDAIYEKILGGKGLAFGWQNRGRNGDRLKNG